jgi:Pyruvate/2-oxoacid:ferredoxin oxidoreductase delta subunit
MKIKRKIIEIDEELCNGCGDCVPSCAEEAIAIVDGKARVISDKYCDGLGACLNECPQDALRIVEREAEEFDEQAVESHLEQVKNEKTEEAATLPCGCSSARVETFCSASTDNMEDKEDNQPTQQSALTHWPIQIRLVPPHAPFLIGADLLIVSDCTPIAYPDFHRDFLKGRSVLMGCPKFDQQEMYIERFSEIFKNCAIKSVTVVVMEVPCCSGMPMIVKAGMKESGKKVPLEVVTLSLQGEIISREQEAA